MEVCVGGETRLPGSVTGQPGVSGSGRDKPWGLSRLSQSQHTLESQFWLVSSKEEPGQVQVS